MGNGHLNNIRIIGVGLSQAEERREGTKRSKHQAPLVYFGFWIYVLYTCS